MSSWKAHFSRFIGVDTDRLHFAAHSHHFWPDVSFDAQIEAWMDAARLVDRKWDKVFQKVLPEAQAHVARVLALPDPRAIAFATNTHELVLRILSALPDRPAVLTTDAEFHSFTRQIARLEEEGLVRVERVPVEPFATFTPRFAERARATRHDLVFFSHVFFSSGWAVPELDAIASAVDPSTFLVIDGYHAFLAIPTDLRPLASRAFYLGGGYKYAMSGEGACFLHAPPGYAERPRNTGWFAAFGALAERQDGAVAYAADGGRFLGATFDPTALYRFNAVMRWLSENGLDAMKIRAHTRALQERFASGLDAAPGIAPAITSRDLVVPISEPSRGQFLTFRTDDASAIHDRLLRRNVFTDVRGDRLRFGFALYHDAEDVDRLLERMR
jgi:kynureninase